MDGGDCFGVDGGFRSADEKSVAIGIVESCVLFAVDGPVVMTCVTDIVGSVEGKKRKIMKKTCRFD